MIRYFLFCFLPLFLAGCLATGRPEFKTYLVLDASIAGSDMPLADGQVVLSVTPDAMSMVYILGSAEFSRFVHVGVISIEDGQPYVYEALGWGIPWPGERPTDAIQGAILRSSFQSFLARQRTLMVFEPNSQVDHDAVVDYARAAYRRELPFDPYFDVRDHQKVYCTEFVALALEAGGHPEIKPVPGRDNRSLKVAASWLHIAQDLTLPAERLVRSAKPVLLISLDQTRVEILVWDEIRRELYVRFTPEQRLGNLFRWQASGLDYRQDVQLFIDRALAMVRGWGSTPDSQEIREAVSRLAFELYGEPGGNKGG